MEERPRKLDYRHGTEIKYLDVHSRRNDQVLYRAVYKLVMGGDKALGEYAKGFHPEESEFISLVAKKKAAKLLEGMAGNLKSLSEEMLIRHMTEDGNYPEDFAKKIIELAKKYGKLKEDLGRVERADR